MSTLSYSKWDHIEISDDEDDTHPNIDTPSLFRWRHQARLERDTAWKKEKEDFEKDLKAHLKAYQSAREEYEAAANAPNLKELEEKLNKLKVEDAKWQERQKEMAKKERLRPLNIDTICKEGKSKTIINAATLQHEEKSEEDAADRLKTFVEKHDKEIKKLGMFRKPVDTQKFLVENPNLVCEETANQLVLWCLDLAMEEKFELMDHVSHQCIVMQFMLELAKSLKCDPRSCIRPFFAKFINPEPEYQRAFNDELDAFRKRIRARAEVKVQEAVERYEEEERKKRLGPGGLDPLEVFESLTPELQECFKNQDVELLKTTLSKMDPHEAEAVMKLCIDSGLWVENANAATGDEGDASASKETEEQGEEKPASTNE
nr:unnamed protein product [Spirometra erinaceieuropaei]